MPFFVTCSYIFPSITLVLGRLHFHNQLPSKETDNCARTYPDRTSVLRRRLQSVSQSSPHEEADLFLDRCINSTMFALICRLTSQQSAKYKVRFSVHIISYIAGSATVALGKRNIWNCKDKDLVIKSKDWASHARTCLCAHMTGPCVT